MKSAFTLIELVLVVIIVGILASLALPMFGKTFEVTKANEAVAALHQIRTGERIYRQETNTYWASFGVTPRDHIDNINATLRLFLDRRDNRNWDYSIVTPTADTFTAMAVRRGGGNDGESITIDETGAIDKSGWSP